MTIDNRASDLPAGGGRSSWPWSALLHLRLEPVSNQSNRKQQLNIHKSTMDVGSVEQNNEQEGTRKELTARVSTALSYSILHKLVSDCDLTHSNVVTMLSCDVFLSNLVLSDSPVLGRGGARQQNPPCPILEEADTKDATSIDNAQNALPEALKLSLNLSDSPLGQSPRYLSPKGGGRKMAQNPNIRLTQSARHHTRELFIPKRDTTAANPVDMIPKKLSYMIPAMSDMGSKKLSGMIPSNMSNLQRTSTFLANLEQRQETSTYLEPPPLMTSSQFRLLDLPSPLSPRTDNESNSSGLSSDSSSNHSKSPDSRYRGIYPGGLVPSPSSTPRRRYLRRVGHSLLKKASKLSKSVISSPLILSRRVRGIVDDSSNKDRKSDDGASVIHFKHKTPQEDNPNAVTEGEDRGEPASMRLGAFMQQARASKHEAHLH